MRPLDPDLWRKLSPYLDEALDIDPEQRPAWLASLGAKEPGLSVLELGKVYTDEQTFAVPKADVVTPKITIVVGVWNEAMRLPVVSGPSDGHAAAIVTHLSTGVPRRGLVKVLQGTKK